MARKVTKTSLKKKLDLAWAKAVKENAKNKCEVCGKTGSMNAHHYVSRSNLRLRWELYNGICVCPGHHLFGNESFHKDPEFGHYWMEENRWKDLCKINVEKAKGIKKWNIDDMKDKLEELKNI